MPAPARPACERKRRRLGSAFIFYSGRGREKCRKYSQRSRVSDRRCDTACVSMSRIRPRSHVHAKNISRGTVTTRGRCVSPLHTILAASSHVPSEPALSAGSQHAAVERTRRRLSAAAARRRRTSALAIASAHRASSRYSNVARYVSPGRRIARRESAARSARSESPAARGSRRCRSSDALRDRNWPL